MPVESTTSGVIRIGNGLTTEFSFSFAVTSEETIGVATVDGLLLEAIDQAEYTVLINSEGTAGSVTFAVAPADGEVLYISRTTSITQLVEVTSQNKYDPVVVQQVWDKLTLIAQELRRDVALAVISPPNVDPQNLFELFQENVERAEAAEALAQAWAESATPPDPMEPTSKSAKTWAAEAEASASRVDLGALDAAVLATGNDRVATGLDRVQTGLDVIAATESAVLASEQAVLAETLAAYGFDLKTLFVEGEAGFYTLSFDPAAGHVFTDTGHTTVAAVGDLVAAVLLKSSGGDIYATQGTSGDRPKLGRRPDGGVRNMLWNSAQLGAVVGAPGTLPTGWGAFGGSLVREVIGQGTDANGFPYTDLKITGSPGTSGVINLANTNELIAVAATDYIFSLYMQIVAGSAANVTEIVGRINWRNAGASQISTSGKTADAKAAGAYNVYTVSGAAPALTAFAMPQILLNCSGAVDFTLRIGGGMLEAGTARTDWQRTALSGLDVTETAKQTLWYLNRPTSNVQMTATLPDLGANATVATATASAATIATGQTIGAGSYNLLPTEPSKLFSKTAVSRPLESGETVKLNARLDADRGADVFLSPLNYPPLVLPAQAVDAVALTQGAATYKTTVQSLVTQTGGFVTPMMFGAAGDGTTADHDAVAAAFATGRPVLIDRLYRLTTALTLPAYAQFEMLDPFAHGFVLDMASGGLTIGAGSVVPKFRAISTAYPASALADTAAWELPARGIALGASCRIGFANVSDLTEGFDVSAANNSVIEHIKARNLRSRYGWAAAINGKGMTGFRVNYSDVADCDRGIEPEDGARDCHFGNGRFVGVYPVGFAGQSGSYATYSFVAMAHGHDGLGSCERVSFGDIYAENCLGGVGVTIGNSDDLEDYCKAVTFGDVVIKNPRNYLPIEMGGIGTRMKSLTFKGAGNASLARLIRFGLNSGVTSRARDQVIEHLEVDEGAYVNSIAHINSPGSAIESAYIGSQGGTSPAVAVQVQAQGGRARLENIHFEAARSHAALYDVEGAPGRILRSNTSYTQHGSNPIAATRSAAWIAATGKTETGNDDL